MRLGRLGEVFERHAKEGESPVTENPTSSMSILSSTGRVKPGVKLCRPRHKAKYTMSTDSEQYREGKVKRTPVRGVKKNLKLDAYKRSELLYGVTAYLLYNESGSLCMRRA